MADDVRKTALFILNAIDKEHQTLDILLEKVLAKHVELSKRDLALLYALVYGVLRWRGRLDWIIKHFSKTRLNRINPQVMNILRLGLFQVVYLTRIPVSAAVNTSVEMAKAVAAPWIVKYVNGLLRNAVKNYQQVPFPDVDRDPVISLASRKSFPQWLIQRWLDRLGLEETGRLCDAVNTIPPITVRANRLRATRQTLMESLQGIAENVTPTPLAPEGVSFSNPKTSIPEMDGFRKGLFCVQDEAAQLVTLFFNPQPDEKVLDACAGLGGKTGHMAQMMENRGRITAMDHDERKLLRLKSEMTRLGISIVNPCACDLKTALNAKKIGMFDRILLDAPCSGLGVLRRNPDAKWIASKQDLVYFQKKQIRFLGNLAPLVKPYGLVVYTVCSFEPEENEAVVKLFLNQHKNFAIENDRTEIAPQIASLIDQEGYFRSFPHLHNMDGFFAVRLKRTR